MTMTTENKIPAFPVLEPLSKATATALAPLKLLDTDFLEIDVDKTGEHFVVQAVCLKRCPTNVLPSADAAATPAYVTTPNGAFYKDDGFYHYPSFNASTVWFRRIPERSQKGFGQWKLAGTDYTALIIHHAWPHHNLIFKSEEAQLLYTFLLKRFFVQSNNATIAAKFKLTKDVPDMPADFVENPKLPLTDYQKTALFISLNNLSYALFMEQGVGKTPVIVNRVSLEAARKRAADKGMYRVLIICPQQVRLNWQREFARFATSPGKTCILRGDNLKKMRVLTDGVRDEEDCAWSANIISIDSVRSVWAGMKRIKWDLVVIDESHKIKNASTNRYKDLMEINEFRASAKTILTGTPITNTIFDLWAQFEWMGKGLSGFSTFANFRAFHGKWEQANVSKGADNGIRKLIGFKNVPLVQERLARLSFLITKKESGLNLPEKVYDIYEVAMTQKQAEIYKAVATKLVAEIDEMLADAEISGANITAEHILTKLIRLAQVCSGFVKTDDIEDIENDLMITGKVFQITSKNPKIDSVVNMIREDHANSDDSKCIIWATFIEDIRAISERLATEGIKHVGYHKTIQQQFRVKDSAASEDVINRDDSCRVLVANPASAGVGQNYLGYNTDKPEDSSMRVDHHIYFSCNWSATDRIQSEDRSHRRGTRSNLRITDLVIPYTIDQEIRDRVNDKRALAMSIQDIRNILNNVLKGYRT